MSRISLSLLVVALLIGLSGAAQSSAELKKRQQKLREDIEYKEKLLAQIKENTKSSSTKIVLIDKKINQREELIRSLREEIEQLGAKIESNQALIESLEEDISRLKEEYAKMIVQAYKTRHESQTMMFFFSSKSFDQAFKRLKYMQQLGDYRRKQAQAILYTQQSLEEKKKDLERQRDEKRTVLNDQDREKAVLSREKGQKEQELQKLSKEESKYRKELAVAQRRSNELREAIKKAIEMEMRASREKSKSTASGYQLTPEAKELSNNFTNNKGQLPWPVDKGEITALFGEQPHAFLKGIKVKNNGITISTTPESRARAVFDGTVSKIMILPGAGKIVMVRHGEYISIYTNLKETFVNTGDKLSTKEEIGVILTDRGKTEIEFQLWKDVSMLNPSDWLYKAR